MNELLPSPRCLAEESQALCRQAQRHKTRKTQRQTTILPRGGGRGKRLPRVLVGG